MSRARDRKLYVAALGVALGGLALDRVLLSGGALGPVEAEASSPAPDAAGSGPVGGPLPAPEPDTSAQLANRLKELEQERGLDLTRVRNAFWLEGVSKQPESAGAEESDPAVAAFRETHKLRTVMAGPQGSFVVVGKDRLYPGQHLEVKVGDRTERFTLREIQVDHDGRRAVFEFNGRAVALTMDPRNIAGTGGNPQDGGVGGR